MKAPENLPRWAVETHKVRQSLRYRWLTFIYVILALASPIYLIPPQYWQLRRVQRHIANVRPQWDAFKRTNPGFEAIELYPMTDSPYAWGVMFAARGRISPNVNSMRLAEFMWSTKPPSSVDVSMVTTDYTGLQGPPASPGSVGSPER